VTVRLLDPADPTERIVLIRRALKRIRRRIRGIAKETYHRSGHERGPALSQYVFCYRCGHTFVIHGGAYAASRAQELGSEILVTCRSCECRSFDPINPHGLDAAEKALQEVFEALDPPVLAEA